MAFEENRPNILRKILDNSYDEIFVIDRDQTIIYVNPVCQQNYGLKPEEILGKKASDLINQGYCGPPVAPEVFKKHKRITIEQTTSVGKTMLCTATPVFDENGEIELIVENSRDITQLENIKQNLEDATELVKRYKQELNTLRKKEMESLGIIAHSKQMNRILELLQNVAPTDSSIFIYGKSGTGKSLLTKYIHKMSNRAEGPFITINCSTIPETLFEAELFGYDSGAFTGAHKKGKLGLIELASEGTLFLDEIAEIPLHLQAKLLEVIQNREFYRIGGQRKVNVDVRIIAASNQDIKSMVAHGNFREDLYYRLRVIEIEIPSLRERTEDMMPLIYLFLNQYDKRYNTHHLLAKETLDILLDYHWPGNVRELEHLMERLVVTVQDSTITPEHLPQSLTDMAMSNNEIFDRTIPLKDALDMVTKELVTKTYSSLGSSYKVARALKISQSRASRLIRRYVNREDSKN